MTRKRFNWADILAIVSFVAGFLLPLFYQVITQQLPIWLIAIDIALILASIYYLCQKWFAHTLQPLLEKLTPWLILLLISINGLILYHTWPIIGTISIRLDDAKAALFNSYEHSLDIPPYLAIVPNGDKFTWKISDGGRTGNFSVKVASDLEPTFNQSSGGYITFYGNPIDRLQYRTVHFRLKITDASGTPDIGIRLVVDNPKAAGDRELVTYEIESLAKYSKITEDWQAFDMPIGDFQQVRYEPPFPENIDANKINKLVFFIDNRIGKQCTNMTVWVSEIEFKP